MLIKDSSTHSNLSALTGSNAICGHSLSLFPATTNFSVPMTYLQCDGRYRVIVGKNGQCQLGPPREREISLAEAMETISLDSRSYGEIQSKVGGKKKGTKHLQIAASVSFIFFCL
jgi:hypothetical protein